MKIFATVILSLAVLLPAHAKTIKGSAEFTSSISGFGGERIPNSLIFGVYEPQIASLYGDYSVYWNDVLNYGEVYMSPVFSRDIITNSNSVYCEFTANKYSKFNFQITKVQSFSPYGNDLFASGTGIGRMNGYEETEVSWTMNARNINGAMQAKWVFRALDKPQQYAPPFQPRGSPAHNVPAHENTLITWSLIVGFLAIGNRLRKKA